MLEKSKESNNITVLSFSSLGTDPKPAEAHGKTLFDFNGLWIRPLLRKGSGKIPMKLNMSYGTQLSFMVNFQEIHLYEAH